MKSIPENLMNITYTELTPVQQRDLIKEISKPKGFFKLYFNNLPYAATRLECFNKLNQLHLDIHDQYMYSNYDSFSQQYAKSLKVNH